MNTQEYLPPRTACFYLLVTDLKMVELVSLNMVELASLNMVELASLNSVVDRLVKSMHVGTDYPWLDEPSWTNVNVGTIMINQQRCSYMIKHAVRGW